MPQALVVAVPPDNTKKEACKAWMQPPTRARIINADSMQVYMGMDVITNKVPAEERCGVEHLLMDYKKPGEQLTGPEWIRDAIQAVRFSNLHVVVTHVLRGCGGTQDRGDARAE